MAHTHTHTHRERERESLEMIFVVNSVGLAVKCMALDCKVHGFNLIMGSEISQGLVSLHTISWVGDHIKR